LTSKVSSQSIISSSSPLHLNIMGPTKVFVGNLSFKTKEAELAEEFSTVGKVLTANIITRGYRSLGYGFVEFEKEEDAQSALSSLNKKNLHGREINVELAAPREEGATRSPVPRRGRGGPRGRGGNYGAPRRESYPPREVGDSPHVGEPRGRGGYGSPRGGRGGYRRPNNNENRADASPNNNNNDQQNRDQRPPRRGGYNNRRYNNKAGGPPRAQSANRVPSTTTLFVANLPYQFVDDELLKLLPKATKAYVAKNYSGRSKGFGFVEFANEEDQKAALAASDKLQASGRDLIVKIALTEEKKLAAAEAPVAAQ